MRILAVDLSSLARWAWSMAAESRISEGEAFGLVLRKVEAARPGHDRVAICRDWGRTGTSFRRLSCPDYKASRSRPPEPYYAMVKALCERFHADGCSIFPAAESEVHRPEWTITVEGRMHKLFAEADDVIASLASWARREGSGAEALTILSGDTDMWALVDDTLDFSVVTLDGERIDVDTVFGRFGVAPCMVPELKALAGDDSDGYKPFPHWEPAKEGEKAKPGIGIKTAAKLLKDWGTADPELGLRPADAVLLAAQYAGNDAAKEMPRGHARSCLLEGGAKALEMGHRCADMIRDLPINFDVILRTPIQRPIAPEPVAPVEDPPQVKAAEALSMVVRAKDVPAGGLDKLALQPATMFGGEESVMRLSTAAFNSRCFPQFPNVESVAMTMAIAREKGIPAGAALLSAYVVKGRIAWSAAALAAMVKASPVCKVFRIIESTDRRAVLQYQRSDEDSPSSFVFTIEEAEKAGWCRRGEKGDSKWLTNPRTMLRWAAMREAARAFFFDVVTGIYTGEELRGEASNEELAAEEQALGAVMT